jgi:phytoene dehydrogenase-like protein
LIPPPQFKASYDVIIIGAGVAGLTAAALLSKAGLSVCVVEKEPHPGGYLAGFRRKDFRFDTAIHWLNQYSEGGMICKMFDVLGKDYPKAVTQVRIRRFIGDGFSYLLTNRPDELKQQWKEEFPEDAEGIERFFAAARKLARSFKNYGYVFRSMETMSLWGKHNSLLGMLRFALPFIPHLKYSGEKGLKKGLAKYFKSPKLHQVFAADTEILACLIPIAWAYNNDFQSPPQGGGQRIPEWLEHVSTEQNAEIYYKCGVEKVVVENGRVKGVQVVHRGKQYEANAEYVIAACDVETLYEKMLPQEVVPQKLKDRLRAAELYSSSVTVSIALDCTPDKLGFGEELIHIASTPLMAHAGVTNDATSSEISVLAPSLRDKTLAPDGMGTLTLYMPASMDFKDSWRTGTDKEGKPERGEEYKELKSEVAEALIARVSEMLSPSLKDHILFYDVATPVTHWRYTGNRGGTMMGAKPGRANMQNSVARYHTPVKGLLLGGHWAELGGGVPIAVKAAANAALLVLQQRCPEMARALGSYMDGKIGLEQLLKKKGWKLAKNNWVPKPTPVEKKEKMG